MTGYEIYTFVLCLFVLLALSSLFIVFLRLVVKFYLKLVGHGIEDQAILKEADEKRKTSAWDIINNIASVLVCVIMVGAFAFSLYVQITETSFPLGLPSLSVVKSSSMSYKEESNSYLFANQLDNQFDTFDIIVLNPVPDEYDLALYDVVVYEARDGTMIVHRIVSIEEPNASHPDCRYFKFQGDAVSVSDKYPVLYSQMRGIYSGKRLPFIGSFVMFMQSPAGWICILLVLFAIVATPIVEKKIEQAKQARIALLRPPIIETPSPAPAPTPEPPPTEMPPEIAFILELSRSKKPDIRIFHQKLRMAPIEVQKAYAAVVRRLYAYRSLRYSYSERYQTFRSGNTVLVKLTLQSGVLCAYVHADPETLTPPEGVVFSVSTNPSFASCPVKIKLHTDANIAFFLQIIAKQTEGML